MRSSPSSAAPATLRLTLVVFACAVAAPFACNTEGRGASPEGADAGSHAAALCGDEGLTYENFGGPFVLDWCTGCHSSRLAEGERQGAPVGVDFDTLDGIARHRERIIARAVALETMPPVGGPSREDRELLAEWLECGAPVDLAAFSPPPPPSLMTAPPEPLGECAAAREPLPADLLPLCTAATHTCVLDCNANEPSDDAREACRDACTATDTTPGVVIDGLPVACSDCAFRQMLGCGSQNGCDTEVGVLWCCIEECITSGDPACFERDCTGAIQGFAYCVYYEAPSCLDYQNGPIAECFAAP